MKVFIECGYNLVEGDILVEGESWIGKDGGFVVYVKLKEGGKVVFFMI